MPPTGPAAPPAVLRRLLAACIPWEDRASLLEDLDTLFHQRADAIGRRAAMAWYARQTAGFVGRLGARRLAELWPAGGALRSDLSAALRSFRHRPAYAGAFVVTLAMATGVLATIHAAAQWVLLRPVPGVAAPDQLVTIRLGSTEAPPRVSFNLSHPDFLTLQERLPLGGGMLAARTPVEVDVRPQDGTPQRLAGELVTANYFTVLGTPLAAGRAFLPEEDAPSSGQPAVILAHSLARQIANKPADAIGMKFLVNGVAVRVVGVTAPGFRGAELPGSAVLWLPAAALAVVDPTVESGALDSRMEGLWRTMVGRLPEGVTAGQVEAAAAATVVAVREEFRGHSYVALHQVLQVFPGVGLDPGVRDSVRRTLAQLGGAAALLLILATANLTNLTLIESVRRRTLTAIRHALGASRWALARGMLVEMALLGLASGVVAMLLSALWARWYQDTRLSEGGGALAGMHLDWGTGLVTIAAVMAAAGVVYLRPMLAARAHSGESLLRRGLTDSRSSQRGRSMLVALQVALSVVLLVSAGLLGRTVANLRQVDLGFNPDRLLTWSVDPHLHGYERQSLDQLARELEGHLQGEPGVLGAGFISPSPLRSSYITAALYSSNDPEVRPLIGAGFFVTPGMLPALGARVIAGEDPWRADSATMVVTRSTLSQLLPGVVPAAAIGRLVPTREGGERPIRLAAVIEDLHLSDITRDPPPAIFRPLAERIRGMSVTGVLAGGGAPSRWTPLVRRVFADRAPDLPIFDVRTARAAVDLQFADRHAMALAAMTLSGIGLLLAAVGLYGVLSAVIAARRREIGVRSAVGASPRRIVQLVLLNGLAPVGIGLVLGVIASMGVGRFLAAQLFGLEGLDSATWAMAVGALAGASLLAALVPAYRASRVSPTEVLREE